MLRSMTGFGSAVGAIRAYRISVEIRTVNHRFFNPSIKLPSSVARWEGEIRERVRQKVARGHVTIVLKLEREGTETSGIDEVRFAAVVEQIRRLSEQHQLVEPDTHTILRMPGVVSSTQDDSEEIELSALTQVLDAALDALDTMRLTEGSRLRAYLIERLAHFSASLERIHARAPQRLIEQRDKLRQNVRELLDGVAVDEQRLAQEIAILAERGDIAEELDRLGSHIKAFSASLEEGGTDSVGKRLGFLLQEMLREVNTIGSKGADLEILREVVSMKEELERLREQSENIE